MRQTYPNGNVSREYNVLHTTISPLRADNWLVENPRAGAFIEYNYGQYEVRVWLDELLADELLTSEVD